MRKKIDTVEEFWTKSTINQAYKNANEESVRRFIYAFSEFLGIPKSAVNPASSGKSALKRLLLSKKDKRTVVMAPALNCVRVKEAIEEANCRLETYDFWPQAGEFEWDSILDSVSPEVGVLIVTHFFGVPVDLRKARKYCLENDILLIEDCAQTLGGCVAGRQVGTLGDAAIFSFSYDKPISLGWGGMGVINSPEKFSLDENRSTSVLQLNRSGEYGLFLKFVKSIEVRRSLIGASKFGISSIFNRLNKKSNLASFYAQSIPFGSLQAELGVLCLERFSHVLSIRNENADQFSSLCPLPTWPTMNEEIKPAWLKQKVNVSSPSKLRSISRTLQKKGIRAGNFNWPKLMDGENAQSKPNADLIASCWMDVPIHQNMGGDDLQVIVSTIKNYM